MYQKISEGKASLFVPKTEKISRSLPVFYNPVMKFNRDVSVLILKTLKGKDYQIALPLAGTGVRGVRFMLELDASKVYFNDHSENACKLIKKNLKLNKLAAEVSDLDANEFLLNGTGFDYIDIDPFGTPNPFIDSAVKRLSRKGILAVTATDTAPLCGTYPKVCMRKYWARPLRNEMMHEIGLRILIRKIQLIGAQFDKALVPIYSYYKDHYFRVYLKCRKGKKHVDSIIKNHSHFEDAGPMWLGEFWDQGLAEKIAKSNADTFLRTIADEAKVPCVGFYDIHTLAKKHKIRDIPKISDLLSRVKQSYPASRTHFLSTAIRTNMPIEEFLKQF